ncbi:DUF2971 domain-containing protein [Cognatilysobacter terrigena]|uniref:DUF2971 domain-containing protein n=1 Tax=Cognatilysobacter terrigena TaxID=2488749 RepID=UPI00105D19E1|nr:DUF2971 domain-containing protein [Lysobacter terrigena]
MALANSLISLLLQDMRLIHERSEPRPPATLWHYTSAAGLKGILETKTIRLSNAAFLNDKTEQWLGKALFIEAATGRSGHVSDSIERVLKAACQPFYKQATSSDRLSDVYTASFSVHADSLPQWRAYGRGEDGYALGFDTSKLIDEKRSHSRVENLWLSKCFYKPDSHRKLVNRLIELCDEAFIAHAGGPDEAAEAAAGAAAWLSAFLKNAHYKDEGEWRLVLFANEADEEQVGFVEGPVLKPYWPYTFEPGSVNGAVVGPQRHMDLAVSSVRLLLRRCNALNAVARPSAVPFRNVG